MSIFSKMTVAVRLASPASGRLSYVPLGTFSNHSKYSVYISKHDTGFGRCFPNSSPDESQLKEMRQEISVGQHKKCLL